MDDREKLDELMEEVTTLADPAEIKAVTLGVEHGSGVLRIPFASATIVRDEFGRVSGMIGEGWTKRLIRDENGLPVKVYEEREEIVPD
jgi:hypothetical protein